MPATTSFTLSPSGRSLKSTLRHLASVRFAMTAFATDEDRHRRAVVLLELDDARALEVPVEVEDVAHVGPSPSVDGLVVVPHRADVAARRAEKAQHLELRAVRVLVLVDEDVQVAALPAGARILVALPEARDLADEVVEVERLELAKGGLVPRIDDLRDLVVRVALALGELFGALEGVLRVRDAREHGLRVVGAIGAGRAEELLHERRLVALVEDRERPADRLALALQDAQAERVERAHREPARPPHCLPRLAEHLADALAHLAGGLVRERQGDDGRRAGCRARAGARCGG